MDLPTIEKMAADLILMATRLARAVEDVLNPRPNKAPLAIYDEATGRWKLPEGPKTAVFTEFVLKDPIKTEDKGATIKAAAKQLDAQLAEYEAAKRTAEIRKLNAEALEAEARAMRTQIISSYEIGAEGHKRIEFLEPQVGTLSIPPTWFRMQDGGFINLQNLRSAWPQPGGNMTVYHGEQRFDLSGDDALQLTYRLTMLAADECHLASETQQRSGDPLAGDPYDAT